jgi:hypothetical protein
VIANYTTQVMARKSLGEIMGMLADHGATQVLINHGPNGVPRALAFQIKGMAFRMPIYPDAVAATLKKQGAQPRYQTAEHATNVAWRVVRDWLRAQLALIESGMVALDEIMLPYALTEGGKTALERYRDGTLLLAAGGE